MTYYPLSGAEQSELIHRDEKPLPAVEGPPDAAPTEQPKDARGRFMLNSYGRQCFDLGFAAGKAARVLPVEPAQAREPK